jgi:demethylmenaquinone methyltransferase/2-methoxy-6-polyprenyl-1,4-benzoquinol methylase
VGDQPDLVRDASSLLASQRTYYDVRADEYGDASRPDRKAPGLMPADLGRSLVEAIDPYGDVLELACGTGFFTRELVRHARSVTAVDASPRMLAINRSRVGDPKVTYIQADLFAWSPTRTYDVVFFGFWLSHVPPDALADFWALVRRCLAPGGRVAFVDEDARAAGHDEVQLIGGVPAARRALSDGRQFEIVKVFWQPDSLEGRVRALGWEIDVRSVGETFLYGSGQVRSGR